MEHSDKVGRMEEAIALLRQASTFGRLTWRSQHISLDNVELKPSFVQRPIPIWMVANPTPRATRSAVDRALARVAHLGDGWMTFAVPPSVLAERISRLKQLRAERGRVESELRVCLYIDVNVNVNEAVAIDDAVRTCKLEGRQNATPEQLMSIAAIGSATRCAEFIKRLIDAGATDLALRPVTQHPIHQMELITELLLPQIKPTLTTDSVTTS
jgi:alkanesulfonate monooxygenase SsuD/methylene tetrahydromethanopterin reductase-like flavin-dependent oxidoreductase (luciferase family)